MIPQDKPYLIGETAYNHEGNFDYLMQMVLRVRGCVSAIKFHLLIDADDYIRWDHPMYGKMKEMMLTEEEWQKILSVALEENDVVVLCDDPKSVEFILREFNNKKLSVEVHASGINDIRILSLMAEIKGTAILGIGGCSIEEISFAIDFLRERGKDDIFLMYGFQAFPTDRKFIQFDRMLRIRDFFKLPLGYADHCSCDDRYGNIISASVCAFGINVVEKHFTLNKGENRIDWQSAVSIDDLKEIWQLMNMFWQAYGYGNLSASRQEKDYMKLGPNRKVPCYSRDIDAGEKLQMDDIIFLRVPEDKENQFLSQKDVLAFIGRCVKCAVKKGNTVDKSHFDERSK